MNALDILTNFALCTRDEIKKARILNFITCSFNEICEGDMIVWSNGTQCDVLSACQIYCSSICKTSSQQLPFQIKTIDVEQAKTLICELKLIFMKQFNIQIDCLLEKISRDVLQVIKHSIKNNNDICSDFLNEICSQLKCTLKQLKDESVCMVEKLDDIENSQVEKLITESSILAYNIMLEGTLNSIRAYKSINSYICD
jgi:hypothetical protein